MVGVGTKERREHLRQNKFFECDCARCADAAELGTFVSAVRCRRCPTGAVVLERPLDQHRLPGFPGLYLVLPACQGFYLVVLGLTVVFT